MRADCEMVVSSSDLSDAIYFLSESYDDCYVVPESVIIRPWHDGITVVTSCGDVEIDGAGRWSRNVGVDGYRLAVLTNKLSGSEKIRLLFTGTMLFLNSTGMDAFIERPATKLEPSGQGWQQMLPGMIPVSSMERLNYRISQPMRPRVRQRSLVGTTLFGK